MTTEVVTVSLEKVSHHGGTVRSKNPLTVETSPLQWAYAVSVRLALPENSPHFAQLPIRVSARVSVESGQLGCLLAGDDWETLLGRMPPTVGAGRYTIDLIWEQGHVANLVFRNHGPGNRSCVFTVESVQLSPAPAGWDPHRSQIDDVVELGGSRLDLSKLRKAIERSGIQAGSVS